MDFENVFIKMFEMFLVIAVGYGAGKFSIIDSEGKKKLTSVVVNITLPATILSAVMNQDELPTSGTLINIMIFATLSYIIIIVLSYAVSFFLHADKRQLGIYRYILIFGNIGFIGYPVTQAVFGKSAILYTSIFGLPFNCIVYSLGIMLIKKSASEDAAGGSGGRFSGREFLKALCTPCMAATVISVIMAFANWTGPRILGETFAILDGVTTPASLMIIGASLAELPVKQMFANVRIYVVSLVKLIVIPLVVYYVFRLLVKDSLLLGISVIISAMPVAANGTILCFEYGGDEKLMAQGTFITTLMSIFTIPLLAMFIS